MRRTQNRPIPSGRMRKEDALGLGLFLAVLSVMALGIVANWLAAALLVSRSSFMSSSTQCGSSADSAEYRDRRFSGSLAAYRRLCGGHGRNQPREHRPFLHHFHLDSAAFLGARSRESRGIWPRRNPMMPNVKGSDRTRREIFFYTLLLAPLGLTPWLIGFASRPMASSLLCSWSAMLVFRRGFFIIRTATRRTDARSNFLAFRSSIFSCFLRKSRANGCVRFWWQIDHEDCMKPHSETRGLVLTPEQQKTRRQRNVAIAFAIGCFVLLFYVVTIAKLGPGVLSRPL